MAWVTKIWKAISDEPYQADSGGSCWEYRVKTWLSVGEAARESGYTEEDFEKLIESGRLPTSFRLGRRVVHRGHLNELMHE